MSENKIVEQNDSASDIHDESQEQIKELEETHLAESQEARADGSSEEGAVPDKQHGAEPAVKQTDEIRDGDETSSAKQQFEEKSRRNKLVVVFFVLITILVSWSGYIDRNSEGYVDRAMVNALVAYGTARVIKAVVEELESVNVGVGIASGNPFRFLKPLGDTVNDFAEVVKASIGSLIIQKIFIKIASTNLFKILLTVLGIGLVISLIFDFSQAGSILFKLFLTLVLVRFLFVFALMMNSMVSQAFLEDNIAAKVQGIEHVEKDLKSKTEQSWWDKVKSTVSMYSGYFSKEKIEKWILSMIELAANFLMQTVLLPIIFLYLLLKGFRSIWGVDVRSLMKKTRHESKEVVDGAAG